MTRDAPSATAVATTPSGKRIGRPPRIDREVIAQAVLEIGFEDITMKRAAEHLGVSVPGLYHYVSGKDDLVRLAAEYSLSLTSFPTFAGQDWQAWLREWAHHTRDSMSSQPEMLEQYLSGGIDDERFVVAVDSVIEGLVALGFEPADAMTAWELVSSIALGVAASDIRERAASESGRSFADRIHTVLATRPPDEFRALRAALSGDRHSDSFERRLDLAMVAVGALVGKCCP